MDFISSLNLSGKRSGSVIATHLGLVEAHLRVGYAGHTEGRLGQLDFAFAKNKVFHAQPQCQFIFWCWRSTATDGIGNIVIGTDGDLWMSVGHGIRQFHVARNSWGSLPTKGDWVTFLGRF